jgi:hypothetical protein
MLEGVIFEPQAQQNTLYRQAVAKANLYLCNIAEQTRTVVANTTKDIASQSNSWDDFLSELVSGQLFNSLYTLCPADIQTKLISHTVIALNGYHSSRCPIYDTASLEATQNAGTLGFTGKFAFNLARYGLFIPSELEMSGISQGIYMSLRYEYYPFQNAAQSNAEFSDRAVYLLGDKRNNGMFFKTLDKDGVFGKCPGAHNLTNHIFRGWGEASKTIDLGNLR